MNQNLPKVRKTRKLYDKTKPQMITMIFESLLERELMYSNYKQLSYFSNSILSIDNESKGYSNSIKFQVKKFILLL